MSPQGHFEGQDTIPLMFSDFTHDTARAHTMKKQVCFETE